MILNPIGGEAGPLKAGDQLILLSRVFLDPTQPLPTVPPVEPDARSRPESRTAQAWAPAHDPLQWWCQPGASLLRGLDGHRS